MSTTNQAAKEALARSKAVAHAAPDAFTKAVDFAGQRVRKYPLHAVGTAFAKGILLGLYLRR